MNTITKFNWESVTTITLLFALLFYQQYGAQSYLKVNLSTGFGKSFSFGAMNKITIINADGNEFTVNNVSSIQLMSNIINMTFDYSPLFIEPKITAFACLNGTIDPSGYVIVNEGGSKSFTISPDQGYFIPDVLDVIVDEESVGGVENYEITIVTKAHPISVEFKIASTAIT